MTESPFQRDEAHFSEAAYFDELAEDDEVAEDLKECRCLYGKNSRGKNLELINSSHTSMGRPKKGQQSM